MTAGQGNARDGVLDKVKLNKDPEACQPLIQAEFVDSGHNLRSKVELLHVKKGGAAKAGSARGALATCSVITVQAH